VYQVAEMKSDGLLKTYPAAACTSSSAAAIRTPPSTSAITTASAETRELDASRSWRRDELREDCWSSGASVVRTSLTAPPW
jgi:hypothetical protein